ncbi:MAG: MFS transporter [Gemmataceae bacterium]
MAALAMIATLPGRTHGLGLITEPLLNDLGLDRLVFALINLWATLIGAAFCLPAGWMIDRVGVRLALAGITLPLGLVVICMSQLQNSWALPMVPALGVLVLLTRGLGQSALSVLSLAVMGKSLGRRSAFGVAIYSILVAVGFMAAFSGVKVYLETWQFSWRSLWLNLGLCVIVIGLIGTWFLQKNQTSVRDHRDSGETHYQSGITLLEAMKSASFWIFALATSLYGLIVSGLSLFNQSILLERGFDRSVFLTITALSPLVGLAGNLLTGWLSSRWSYQRLLSIALVGLSAALALLPRVSTLPQVYFYAVILGFTGGMITVIFFGVWQRSFGTAHLGKIQGAAQMLTVLASALGPVLLASCLRWTGSYSPVIQGLAILVGILALVSWWTPSPLNSPGLSRLSSKIEAHP